MELRGMLVSGTTFVALFFLVCSWFILLGGLSKLQHDCPGECRYRTGLFWWITWFQFFTLILWPFVQFMEGLRHGRTSLMALFAILATLEMLGADNALDNDNLDGYQSGYKTTAAGFILLATFNLVVILLLGFLVGEDSAGGGDVYASGTTTYSNPVAKSTGGGGGAPDNNMRPFKSASNLHGQSVGNSGPTSPPPAAV